MPKKNNILRHTLYLIKDRAKGLWKKYIVVDSIFISCQQFKRDDKKFHLRTTYSLNADSVIFDGGGYVGDWALEMFQKYGSTIYIFEPIREFLDQAKLKFGNNPKIHFLPFGLSDKDETMLIADAQNASSVFRGDGSISIQLRDIKSVMEELGITHIDLLKLNIEGGEFKVLPRMIETGLIATCTDIQVQFHHFYPNAEVLREGIRTALSRTHHLTYDYLFTFENWRKNA